MNFNKLSGFSRMFSINLKTSRSILFEPVYLQFIRSSSTDSIDSTDFPLESLFVRSRFTYATEGVQHHLGLPTFSYILKLWTSNIGKVLTDLHRHRSSLPPEVSDVSKPKVLFFNFNMAFFRHSQFWNFLNLDSHNLQLETS